MNTPIHRAVPEVSLMVAFGNWLTNYGPTLVTVIGGAIGAAYYAYLMYDLYDRRKNRKKPKPKRTRTRA